ncbi:Bud site selection protein, Revert to axial protein 1 [Mortierella alpina]|uniref:Bud site selection protein, Revert to axial protein 1 n=1 Tax=Mortierella alpina TaxID=64518 RepID=A0A9P6LYM3_MORAP|nr:Bud site selection protein, Revert to axial protein 1 [Mortierella alpina]
MSSKNHTTHSPLFPNSFFSPTTPSPSANPSLGTSPAAASNKTPPASNKTPLTTNMTNLTTSSFNNLTSSSFSVSSSISPNNNLSDVGTTPNQRAKAGLNSQSTASPSAVMGDEDDMDEDTDDYEQRNAQSPYTPYSTFPSTPAQQYQPSDRQHRDAVATLGYTEPALMSPDMLLRVEDVPHDLAQLHAQSQGHEHFQTIPLSPARVKTAPREEGDREQHQRHRSLQISSSGTEGVMRQQPAAFSDVHLYSSGTRENSHNPLSGNKKGSYSVNNNSRQQGSQMLDPAFSTASDDALVHQLPSLKQVLNRKTLPPVCLFNFYLYMRDFEKSSEEIDFWLDVTEHEVRWRRYARAAKRRMAVAAQERIEREERDRLARSLTESQMEEQERELEQDKKSHRQKPSVTLDMYEPHWSAANRYLEMSDSGGAPSKDQGPTNGSNSSNNKMEANSFNDYKYNHNSNRNAPGHGGEDPRDTKEVLQEDPAASPFPKSPLEPSPTIGRVQMVHLSGAVPDNWAHPDDANKRDHAASVSDHNIKALGINNAPSLQEPMERSDGPALGTTVHRVATNTTVATRSTANTGTMRRGGTTATAGVTKDELLRSAERIYYKYLIPQAECPVRIPSAVRHRVALFMDGLVLSVADTGARAGSVSASGAAGVGPARTQSSSAAPGAQRRKNTVDASSPASAPSATSLSALSSSPGSANEKTGLQQPQPQPEQGLGLVFSEARDMVFEGMESYYFPRFIKNRAYGNMWRSHRLARLVLGLFILFIGFTVMLTLIFLNVRPRSLRAWALIPIFLGIMLCTTFQFNLCPIMAALGVSETKWMQFAKIKEPYILSLHRKRALKVMVVAMLYTACVGLVFGLVPGHRL